MSDSELSAALDLNIHEPFDTASGYMTDWDITNTGGNYQRNEPIPYTDTRHLGMPLPVVQLVPTRPLVRQLVP